MLEWTFSVLLGFVGQSDHLGSPWAREKRAYRKAYERADEVGPETRDVLAAELKAASVPGAYDDPDTGRLRSAFVHWDQGHPPSVQKKRARR
jgi:hypothetical protein